MDESGRGRVGPCVRGGESLGPITIPMDMEPRRMGGGGLVDRGRGGAQQTRVGWSSSTQSSRLYIRISDLGQV